VIRFDGETFLKESRHVINLRGPWQWSDGSPAEQVDPEAIQRFQFPDELTTLGGQTSAKRLLLTRDFGRPSGLTEDHRVELVINQFAGCRDVTLNGEHLDFDLEQPGLGRCNITSHIQWRNRLRIDYDVSPANSPRPQPLHDVRVEIVESE